MNLACFSDFLVLLDCHLVRVWCSVDLALPFKAIPQAQKRITQFLLKLIRWLHYSPRHVLVNPP